MNEELPGFIMCVYGKMSGISGDGYMGFYQSGACGAASGICRHSSAAV